MPTVIMPVGKSLGPFYPYVRPPAEKPEYYQVHAGEELHELSEDEAWVWDVAHQEVRLQAEHKFTREVLERVAREMTHVSEPAPHVDRLLGLGALVEIDLLDDDRAQEEFLRAYRLVPAGHGFGNSPDRPHMYRLGIADRMMVEVTLEAKYVWAYSYIDGSMWAGCESFAEGTPETSKATTREVAVEISRYLPWIVASTTGVIEPIR